MSSNSTNYKSGSISKQDVKQWNNFTVQHEIDLCREALYGCDEYSLRGLLREPESKSVKIAIDVWSIRLSRALDEGLKRELLSQEDYGNYQNELDLKLLIQYTPSNGNQ